MSNNLEGVNPIVSVIIATKNCADTLPHCIESFIGQTYRQKELIIMDGGSKDGTLGVISYYSSVIHYWESEHDRGIAHAWNKALEYTRGQWIIFLGGDDTFFNHEVLSDFIREITTSNDGRVVYGMVRLSCNINGYMGIRGTSWDEIRTKFFSEQMMIPHQACFHHHTIFSDFGLFREEFSIAADYDLLLRALKREKAVFLPNLIVADMAFGGISSRITSLQILHKEFEKALKINGFKPKGFRRIANLFVYRVLSLCIKYGGERLAASIMDVIRILQCRKPIWSNKYLGASIRR